MAGDQRWPVDPNGIPLNPDLFLGQEFEDDDPLRQHLLMLWDGLSDLIEDSRISCRDHRDLDWLKRMLENANKLYEAEGGDKVAPDMSSTAECPNCREQWTDIEADAEIETTWQQWQCPACGSWNDKDLRGRSGP